MQLPLVHPVRLLPLLAEAVAATPAAYRNVRGYQPSAALPNCQCPQASADNAALVQQLEAELERLRQTMSQLQRTCVGGLGGLAGTLAERASLGRSSALPGAPCWMCHSVHQPSLPAVTHLLVMPVAQLCQNARRPPPLPHRSQHEHLYEAHPYRPFPTEALEAAVAAVPLESYPEQERKLAQFGREFVYFRAPYPPPGQQQQMGGSGEGGAGTGRPPLRGARRQRDVAAAAASGSMDASLSSVGSDGEEEGEPGGEPVAALVRPRPPPRHWAPMHAWVRETLAFVAAYPRLAGGQRRRGSCAGYRCQRPE